MEAQPVNQQALGLACTRMGDLQLACAAVCVSKACREALLKYGARTLTVQLNTSKAGSSSCIERLAQQACWLSKYSLLVNQLILDVWCCSETAVSGLLQLALAAVQPEVLRLNVTQQGMLQCLHSRRLRQLHCTAKQLASAAAEALAGLQQLTLEGCPHPMVIPLEAAGRLTALQKLALSSPSRLDNVLEAGWKLPRLQQLQLYCPDGTAGELLRLNALPQLCQLSLAYFKGSINSGANMMDHAGVWGRLAQLKSLKIHCHECSLPPLVTEGIKAATQLTALVLGARQQHGDTPLSNLLQPLTQLQHLGLDLEGHQRDVLLPTMGQLSRRLTSLGIRCKDLSPAAVTDLSLLTHLTELRLHSTVTHEQLAQLAAKLTGLRRLVLSDGDQQPHHCEELTQGVLALMPSGAWPLLCQLVLVGCSWQRVQQGLQLVRPHLRVELSHMLLYADWMAAPGAGQL